MIDRVLERGLIVRDGIDGVDTNVCRKAVWRIGWRLGRGPSGNAGLVWLGVWRDGWGWRRWERSWRGRGDGEARGHSCATAAGVLVLGVLGEGEGGCRWN